MRLRQFLISALACGLAAAGAAQTTVRVRIVAPTPDTYLSGPARLVAVIEPATGAADVTEVTFFADGRQVCAVAKAPYECDWSAGDRIAAHQIRAVAALRDGRRVIENMRTRDLDYAEAVDVDVVQVTAVVTDGNGRFVRGLKAADFAVAEDGKPQKITHFAAENIPLELVTAIDVSASMVDALPGVRAAAKRFLSALEPRDQVTLLGFNDNIFTLARRSTDHTARDRAIDRLAAWGGTALYDVIIQALDTLGRQSGRRSMVLFSDGDDKSSHATLEAAIARTEESDATIYAVGQGRAVHSRDLQKLMERLAEISGGRSFFSEEPEKLNAIFAEIIEDIRNQYLLAYPAPSDKRDGVWHRIQVQVPGGKYRVRARQGYRLSVRR
jgi:VWFA-related protein